MPHASKSADEDREGRGYGTSAYRPDRPGEFERVSLLAELLRETTESVLDGLGVANGWRCLDLGAGAGHVAAWLADRVGSAEVLAVDRDIRFLRGIPEDVAAHASRPNPRVVEADVQDPDFVPGGRFDLVHARTLLMHLPRREELVRRMASWLRPGGWIVVTDIGELGSGDSPSEAFRATVTEGWRTVASVVGTDPHWARRAASRLAEHGLVDIGVRADLPVLNGGNVAARFWELNFRLLAPSMLANGVLTAEQLAETIRLLRSPSHFDFCGTVITTWGRRPVTDP